jgi:hypothetical protein
MTPDWLKKAFLKQLKTLADGPPKCLVARLQADAKENSAEATATDLTELIENAPNNDKTLTTLGMYVHGWDAEPAEEEWTDGTAPSTDKRRDLICKRLGLNEAGAAVLLAKRPLFIDKSVVITAPWKRWYTVQRANEKAFYWPHYADYLLNVRDWPEESVTGLGVATTRVVERLADPTRVEAYQAKGLVVGYVQSGKTANFTGVIAKAIDVGYRLVIIMTGTIEMLRGQTQRRIDMEMVGKQNIVGDLTQDEALAAKRDYQDDNDWNIFQDFGGEPIETSIKRLTRHNSDYKDEFENLIFEHFDVTKPLYDPANLYPTAARLVVTKKNSTVLKNLVGNVRAHKKLFEQVPVLIIDDESDQASVNTIDPDKQKSGNPEEIERRAINGHIAELLKLMPRAQYVGYTATPFANVFVDPGDHLDIYPKDFIVSLPEPKGYMGVKSFHDLDPVPVPLDALNSNFEAYVRNLGASEKKDDDKERAKELARALDMFVLTGACKLYRADQSASLKFKHHTMLVHESVRQSHMKELAVLVKQLWGQAGFTTPAGIKRLRNLYEDDVLRVSRARIEDGVPALPDFEILVPYIGKTVSRITEHDSNPTLVVNNDAEVQKLQQKLDFDRNRIWRVLIGGAKLSRGFTVEGLTVTYFRRSTSMADSLTQMGRWFGFRHGYRDLVRLYIDRNAKFGKKTVDLYKAFEAVALDEAAFRDQLSQYAEWDDDKPRVLPSQIPPVVSQHLPWLKPTARNRMFNAVLEEQPDRVLAPSGYPFKLVDQRENLDLWRPLLAECDDDIAFPAADQANLRAFSGLVDADRFVDLVDEMKWMYEYKVRFIEPRLNYIRRIMPGRLGDVLVLFPQPGDKVENINGVGSRKLINRDRRDRGGSLIQKFGEITDPKHRDFVKPLLGESKPKSHSLADLWAPTRGVCLTYLVKEQKPQLDNSASSKPPAKVSHERGLILAFTLYLPNGAIAHQGHVPKFRVLVPDDVDSFGAVAATVDEETAKAAGALV